MINVFIYFQAINRGRGSEILICLSIRMDETLASFIWSRNVLNGRHIQDVQVQLMEFEWKVDLIIRSCAITNMHICILWFLHLSFCSISTHIDTRCHFSFYVYAPMSVTLLLRFSFPKMKMQIHI